MSIHRGTGQPPQFGGVVLADGTMVHADATLAAIGRSIGDAPGRGFPRAGRIIEVVGDATGSFGLEAGLLAVAELAVRRAPPTPTAI